MILKKVNSLVFLLILGASAVLPLSLQATYIDNTELNIDDGAVKITPSSMQLKGGNTVYSSASILTDSSDNRVLTAKALYSFAKIYYDLLIKSSNIVSSGDILIWSGCEDSIPDGYHLCDGTTGTIDLRGRFLLAVASAGDTGNGSGVEEHAITIAQLPAHTHTAVISGETGGTSEGWSAGNGFCGNTGTRPTAANFNYVIEVSGEGIPHNNMPPFYALCYIQRVR